MALPLLPHRRRAGQALAGFLVFGCLSPAAAAADWSITTNLTETASASDNVDLLVDDPNPGIGSFSSIGFDIWARDRQYDFNLTGSWGYQVYFGENQDVPDPQYIPALSANYERRTKDLTFTLGGSYTYTPGEDLRGITFVPGQDPGTPGGEPTDDTVTLNTSDTNADQQNVSANTSVIYKVNDTNTLDWTADAYRMDFFGDNADEATPSTNVGTSLVWTNNRTRRVDLNLTGSADWYSYENEENQVEYVYTLTGGFTNRVTPRFTVTGYLGAQLLDAYQDEAVAPLPSTDTRRTHTTDLGGTGGLSFVYALKSGSITGGIGYGLTPDSDGELSNALTATAGYSQTINDRSSFNIGAGFQLSDSDVDGVLSNVNFSISPSYSYAINRYWNLGLAYSFIYQDNEDGAATENMVNLTISRSYTILP
jgi:hypothetical protein